MTNAETTYQL